MWKGMNELFNILNYNWELKWVILDGFVNKVLWKIWYILKIFNSSFLYFLNCIGI